VLSSSWHAAGIQLPGPERLRLIVTASVDTTHLRFVEAVNQLHLKRTGPSQRSCWRLPVEA
jgi:hypothetical protein